MQVSQFKVVEIAKMSTQGGDTTKYRSRQDMIIQGGDTTKYRSRQYHTTRRRYNKVSEPPIQHYEAEIQQSTGAANTTLRGGDTTKYRSRQYNIRGGDTTKYRSRQYHNIRDGDTITQQLQLLCTATIHRGRDTPRVPTAETVTITLYCYNNTEAEIHQEYQQPTQLQLLCTVTIIPRPRYTKSTNSRHSYNYSVLLQ